MTMTGQQALMLAKRYVGCDASKFRKKYREMTGVGTSGDWCCVFASAIVVGWGGAKLEGLPNTWCPTAREAATKAGRQVQLTQAKAGDVAYFEWTGNDNADHVGIVDNYTNGVLTTVDGNVANKVGVRSRTAANWRKVWIVRPVYAEEPKGKLVVDSVFGTLTCKELQKALQRRGYYKGYEVDGVFGPLTKKAYQQYLKDKGYYKGIIDGVFGALSTKAEQEHLKALAYYSGTIDGVRGPMTKKALQMALNDGRL